MTWRLTEAATVGAAAGGVLVVFGTLVGRPDVAVLGVPLVLGVLWGWLRSPAGSVTAELHRPEQSARVGEVASILELSPAPGVPTIRLRVQAPGHRPAEALVAVDQPRRIRLAISTVRTGRLTVFPVDYVPSGPDEVARGALRSVPPAAVTLLPRLRPLSELPLPFRLQGLTGAHGSRRAGDGGDLHDVNLFTPGDRLRRIDWRVTARRAGQGVGGMPGRLTNLYVRRTFATADATVMLVIDSRDEVGPAVASWGDMTPVRQDEATSLDIAREAAASLARHYLDAGDRVGMDDLGRTRAPVAPAAGRRHLHRLVQRLVLSAPDDGSPARRVRPPHVPSGALVVIFSTFLDDEAARMAAIWRHSGHRVVAVDVLPRADTVDLEPHERIAYEIVRLERVDRLRELERGAVEVVRWEPDARSGGARHGVDRPHAASDGTSAHGDGHRGGRADAAVTLAAFARSRARR
ncbi:DUF58 domain-containing protein [Planctomonas psychrotolerans]|uniref:DUF58 domain-containing protein n=1 Tax=Planctomonas psychrotolerans TaxID=2528712 RepID=UPI00123B66E5|nr:DUF58 domain-containing protein [Planctomonas psychrotolerans]